MSGYLVKQGGNRKNWKKRFCVLSKDSISYYGKKKVRASQAVDFRFCTDACLGGGGAGSHSNRCHPAGRDPRHCQGEPYITPQLLCVAHQVSHLHLWAPSLPLLKGFHSHRRVRRRTYFMCAPNEEDLVAWMNATKLQLMERRRVMVRFGFLLPHSFPCSPRYLFPLSCLRFCRKRRK